MGQKEYITKLLERSEEKKKKSLVIQEIYERYIVQEKEYDFETLLKEIDLYCISWVRKQLWKTGCYSEDTEHTAMQESRFAVWKIIEENRKAKTPRDNFAYYAFGIYKHKVIDEIRKFETNRKKYDIYSLNEPVGDSGKTIEDKIQSVQFDDYIKRTEQRRLYSKIFVMYCQSFLESTTFPPRSLALFYARVLPHLEGAIPETKGASAKWAYEHMGNRDINSLKEDSEKYLQVNIDRKLCWCDGFACKLSETVTKNGKDEVLGKIVYTATYNKGKIEDWADNMHKVTTKKTMMLVVNDAELMELAEEYISNDDALYKLLERGK